MSVTDRLQYESRVRMRYAAIVFAAALLLIAAQLLQLVGPNSDVTENTIDLLIASKREGLDAVTAAANLFGMIGLGVGLTWLFSATRYRNPSLKRFTRWGVIIGPALAGVMFAVYLTLFAIKGHQFASSGNQGYPQAHALISGLVIKLPIYLWELGLLLLAFGIIWVSLNAIRVGLVTKLVGYFGVAAAALYVFQIGAIALLVQAFWLGMLAITLSGRRPNGDLPAWQSGEAVPWPATQRAAAQPRQPRGQRRKVSDQEVLAAVDDREPRYRTEAPSPSTSSGKRKRKRR